MHKKTGFPEDEGTTEEVGFSLLPKSKQHLHAPLLLSQMLYERVVKYDIVKTETVQSSYNMLILILKFTWPWNLMKERPFSFLRTVWKPPNWPYVPNPILTINVYLQLEKTQLF